MSALRSLTVLAVALAAAAPAWADEPEEKWETRAVADKPGPLTLDPVQALHVAHGHGGLRLQERDATRQILLRNLGGLGPDRRRAAKRFD